ncbi:MAG: glutamate--cysteine ligase [Gammaproteobacteria bacterium]|nr:glutamate--cysteine ligase [Gammaproteobacteria bacterium]
MNYKQLERRLTRIIQNGKNPFADSHIGLEKESLRVNQHGTIAKTPHPQALGSALTHPNITTDYSEALLELITPPMRTMPEALDYLKELHKFVYDNIKDEIIWATSMPCVVEGEAGIPIAEYGDSNVGRMKHVYRRGLGYRYGKIMQVIAGVHYNYSLPDDFWPEYQDAEQDSSPVQNFINHHYFGLIRNLQRYGWMIPYLFGASPAVCKSFLAGQGHHQMEAFNDNTYYEPFATSLRMGDIGYTNAKEGETGVHVIYDDVASYARSLSHAIATPCPQYENIGVKVGGDYRQLNSNILQIENEYYSTVRPKQILEGLEKPSLALKRRGVRYVELRSIDVNAFDPLGINLEQLHFLEAFMLFCLLQESPIIGSDEQSHINWNLTTTAHQGRQPGLKLRRLGGEIPLREWALDICEQMEGVCEILDKDNEQRPYSHSLSSLREIAADPQLTPSARMLEEMHENKEGFYHFALRKSTEHHEYFSMTPSDSALQRQLLTLARESLQAQKEIEASEDEDFDHFLARYFAQA